MTRDKPYEFRKVKRIYQLTQYDIDEGSFGGNVKFIAELEEEPFLLAVDENLQTIDVGVLKSNIKKLNKKCLRELEVKGKIKVEV